MRITAMQDEHTMFATIEDATLADVYGGGMARAAGEKLGFGAGVAVTGALAFVPGWNAQVPGQPDGFQKRHTSVVGPKVEAYARTLSPGPWKELVAGVGTGATAAPGWSFEHGL